MTRIQNIGISKAVKVFDIVGMNDTQRTQFQDDLAQHTLTELRQFVGDARPRGEFLFMADPADDPLQGQIIVFTVAAPFDLDELPLGCAARLTDQYQRSTGQQIDPVTVEQVMGVDKPDTQEGMAT